MWFEHRHVLPDVPTSLLVVLFLLALLFSMVLLAQTYILYLNHKMLRSSQEKREKKRTE